MTVPESGPQIRDADGHLIEDTAAIVSRTPKEYQERAFRHRTSNGGVPPLDHFHGQPMEVRGGGHGSGDPEDWNSFLKEVGFSSTVLYPTLALAYGNIVDTEWATVYCRAYNDWVHETYLSGSGPFNAMALIPLHDPQAAAIELRRAVEELGMPGGMLPSNGLPLALGSPMYAPLYEEADRLGCCLSVHGGSHSGFGMDTVNTYAVVHAVGHPLGQMIALGSMVMNGVFEKWPNLRVGYLEGGVAWLLMMLERLERSSSTHAQIDSTGILLSRARREKVGGYLVELLKDDRIFIGCEGEEPALAYAISEVGHRPFLFSSDYPHEVTVESCKEEVEELLENPDISDDGKAAVLGGNADRFYKTS